MNIEAMKQALETLKMCRGLIRNNIAEGVAISSPNPFFSADVDNAITTLRTAIEAAEKREPVGVEPVGEIRWVGNLPNSIREPFWFDYVSPPVGTKLYTTPPYVATPLAAPAPEERKRKWVGLTDDAVYAAAEIAWRAGWAACRDAEFVGEEAEDEAWGYQGATVAHDTEAKLREKNAAQRQSARSAWVGLTDDDIWKDDKIMELNANTGLYMDELVGIARAIEAKLKEKNS